MSSNMIVYLLASLTLIITVGAAIGLPALAVVCIKYFKLKEREMVLEMEYRQSSQQQELALEQRVQRLEDALSSLDHDVRVRLGIGPSATPLESRPDLVESPEAQGTPIRPSAGRLQQNRP
jgi:hypothetical protein